MANALLNFIYLLIKSEKYARIHSECYKSDNIVKEDREMKNIVVYTDKNESKLADVLAQIDDTNVRIESAENLRDYESLNPGLVVVESVPNIKDVLMTTKFKAPTLFIGDVFKGTTVRAVIFDFIKTPVDNIELVIRANAL